MRVTLREKKVVGVILSETSEGGGRYAQKWFKEGHAKPGSIGRRPDMQAGTWALRDRCKWALNSCLLL